RNRAPEAGQGPYPRHFGSDWGCRWLRPTGARQGADGRGRMTRSPDGITAMSGSRSPLLTNQGDLKMQAINRPVTSSRKVVGHTDRRYKNASAMLAVRFDAATFDAVREIAAARGVSAATIVREAVAAMRARDQRTA